ncbi:uncharacterized protein B0P05DRAFT_581019 [Gilbertella persicaria]|uniref:uncharacterized protein n=1 Tax=Gilbertella persicaria TaxID=101096 RepID=UPI00221EB89A|nr:uncharacterized protein B0P05DRAFT_581019 [Gilbertella persicaria]KAI8064321.1 hypothetical protein B0P05DRAFT_581019 [Gilbertella persicaria]
MCYCLRNRSLVDYVFVSYFCNASDPLHSRDKNQEKVLEDGNTQDMLRHINNNNKVCLVVLDHAGLSTNREDLEQLVSISDNESLQKIIVDTLPFNNKVTIYERQKLLNEQQTMKAFECRNRPLQRSK